MSDCSYATLRGAAIPVGYCYPHSDGDSTTPMSVKATCEGNVGSVTMYVGSKNCGGGTQMDLTQDPELNAEVKNCGNAVCDHFFKKQGDTDENGDEIGDCTVEDWLPLALDACMNTGHGAAPSMKYTSCGGTDGYLLSTYSQENCVGDALVTVNAAVIGTKKECFRCNSASKNRGLLFVGTMAVLTALFF